MEQTTTPLGHLGLWGALAIAILSVACATTGPTPPVAAPVETDEELRAVVARRLAGDRTGACFAAAVVTEDSTARAYVCADGKAPTRVGPTTAFEIGSVSKTMTAALLASLMEEGGLSLDQPLAALLPEGIEVPTFEGQPILLRHVVTHTSGLPALPQLPMPNPADPYVAWDPEAVLGALGTTALSTAPGTSYAYSNFASMILSHAVGNVAGSDFEALAKARLFGPLGMTGAFVTQPPGDVHPAQGHLSTGAATPAWNFHPSLAGVGGVRATLDDMVQYVRANLGLLDTPIQAALLRTHQPVEIAGRKVGMNWVITSLSGREILGHEGGTGGFSSFVAFDPTQRRGVVILSDTAMSSLGGLGDLGLHLLDPSAPLGRPRKAIPAPQELLDALVGTYEVGGSMQMTVTQEDGSLVVEGAGHPSLEMGYDQRGDFYPLAFDAILRPQRRADGTYVFNWLQSGGTLHARPLLPEGELDSSSQYLTDEDLAGYAGKYSFMGFSIRVATEDGRLFVEGKGQGTPDSPLEEVWAIRRDVFSPSDDPVEFQFERDDDGVVQALVVHVRGRAIRFKRQAP